MKNDDTSPAAPNDQTQEKPAPDTPWLTERLTDAEIESLRQNKKESLAYAQKAFFPKARIHRGEDDPTEDPKR